MIKTEESSRQVAENCILNRKGTSTLNNQLPGRVFFIKFSLTIQIVKTMETKKMSLANIQGKLSRAEMKNIMAGSASGSCITYLGICDSQRTCCPDLKCNNSTGTGACIYK